MATKSNGRILAVYPRKEGQQYDKTDKYTLSHGLPLSSRSRKLAFSKATISTVLAV